MFYDTDPTSMSANAAEHVEKNRNLFQQDNWLINSFPDATITVADLFQDVADSSTISSRSVCYWQYSRY